MRPTARAALRLKLAASLASVAQARNIASARSLSRLARHPRRDVDFPPFFDGVRHARDPRSKRVVRLHLPHARDDRPQRRSRVRGRVDDGDPSLERAERLDPAHLVDNLLRKGEPRLFRRDGLAPPFEREREAPLQHRRADASHRIPRPRVSLRRGEPAVIRAREGAVPHAPHERRRADPSYFVLARPRRPPLKRPRGSEAHPLPDHLPAAIARVLAPRRRELPPSQGFVRLRPSQPEQVQLRVVSARLLIQHPRDPPGERRPERSVLRASYEPPRAASKRVYLHDDPAPPLERRVQRAPPPLHDRSSLKVHHASALVRERAARRGPVYEPVPQRVSTQMRGRHAREQHPSARLDDLSVPVHETRVHRSVQDAEDELGQPVPASVPPARDFEPRPRRVRERMPRPPPRHDGRYRAQAHALSDVSRPASQRGVLGLVRESPRGAAGDALEEVFPSAPAAADDAAVPAQKHASFEFRARRLGHLQRLDAARGDERRAVVPRAKTRLGASSRVTPDHARQDSAFDRALAGHRPPRARRAREVEIPHPPRHSRRDAALSRELGRVLAPA